MMDDDSEGREDGGPFHSSRHSGETIRASMATEYVNEALGMLQAFASVGAVSFDVTLTDLAGQKTAYQPNRSVEELRRTISKRLEAAARSQANFIIRPRAIEAKLIQLDDLDTVKADRVAPYSFMVLCTSPGNYQAWVAVKDAPADLARRLRTGAGADPTASGSTRVSGSRNFKSKYAPIFPIVKLARANAGNVVTTAALELAGLVAPAEAPAVLPHRVSRPPSGRRRWPSYERCIQHAPPVHQGERPDISRADFTWCMTAIDWGWSIEETAARLLQESSKAQENGESYAKATAQNAAAAVGRRQNLKPSSGPCC
jgi:RepB DNA-primase from phage plasmid